MIEPNARMILFRQRMAALLIGALVALGGAVTPARAALHATLFPNSITNDLSGSLLFSISGVTPGAQVRLEKYADFNHNGVIDANDVLVDSITVTDGALPMIGGVRNLNVPGDEDGMSDGNVFVSLQYP